MSRLEGFDFELLTSTPTRLRATAAAIAMMVAGDRPSLSEVARLAGVSRQALNKDHKPVAIFVSSLRDTWQPSPQAPESKLAQDLRRATASLAKEVKLRKKTEIERDRTLHHLQLATATLAAERERTGRRQVTPLVTRQGAKPEGG